MQYESESESSSFGRGAGIGPVPSLTMEVATGLVECSSILRCQR